MTIQSLSRVALATFFVAAPSLAQTRSTQPANSLASYPARYATINRELPSYRTIAVDMDALGIDRRSTDGGKLEVSCKATDTRRIVATDFGEHGSSVTTFYFWDGSLFLVQIESQRSDQLYGPAVERSDDRLYYMNGRLVQWLDGKNAVQPITSPDARETDRAVRKDAAVFFSRLNGCPTSLLSAADADTAAPAMAPAPPTYDTGMKQQAIRTARGESGRTEDLRERAFIAEMKSDLRNLATYEEQFSADNEGAYFSGKATASKPLNGFTPSSNVTIRAIATQGPPPSWTATATHGKSSAVCATENGVINCGYPTPATRRVAEGPSPSVTQLALDTEMVIPAGFVQSFRWEATSAQPSCQVTGHVEVIAGGSKDVNVLVMPADDYQSYVNAHEAKVYFESGKKTAVTLNVTTGQPGALVLVLSNAFSVVSGKTVKLTNLQAVCR
ncbi:MAG: hypothetical protein ACJ8AK_15780 [Gemmatimonadaceae bacterium]